jgi:hypothetical protein
MCVFPCSVDNFLQRPTKLEDIKKTFYTLRLTMEHSTVLYISLYLKTAIPVEYTDQGIYWQYTNLLNINHKFWKTKFKVFNHIAQL